MAEIILEPTVSSKVIPLTVRPTDVDHAHTGQLVTNKQFNTADTDAWFRFTLDGLGATTGSFKLTLINLQDKSVFNHSGLTFATNPFYYKLDSSSDETKIEIRHAGRWVGQLVVTLANGDSATRKFIFDIEGHILDGTVIQTILLEDYNALIATITGSKDELLQYNIDYATLIADVTTAKETMNQAEITRQITFDALVDSEMIAQNVEIKLTEKERTYAPRLLASEQQLAEKTTDITKGAKRDLSLSTIKRDIPLVGFVDDDGNPAVLTKLRPLAEMYGVPFTICMPSDFIINGNGLSATQLKDLQDSNGFEIASHGKTHTPINTSMTAEQQEIEVYESWRQMREWGLNVETIVYPYGQSTPYAREIVSRYYKAGVSTDVRLNATPLLTYRLGRLQFPTTGWTLANYTAKVDEAIANKSWLIFMLHCGQPEHDAANQIILEQLIQYIQSVNVDIVTISDGIDISGNVIDINEQSIYYAKNGKNNIRDYYFEPIDNSNNNASHNGSHLPNDFTDSKATINILTTSADTATMPNGQRGALLTQKGNQASSVASQFYLTTRGLFYRSGSGTAWHDVFNRVFAGIPVTFTLDFGTIPAGTVVTKDYQIQNMFAGHFIELTNKTNLHRNLMLSKHISGAWTLSINIFNPTANPIIVGEVGFDVLWMKPAI